MNRVYQIVEENGTIPVQFSSKASTEEGVFRSFAKNHTRFLVEGTIYYLYLRIEFGYGKIAAAYWNGKAFIKVACKTTIESPFLSFSCDSKDVQ